MAKAIPSARTTHEHTRVADASAVLKRFYTLERGLMRACAGWFIRTHTVELKHYLAEALWQHAQHADALRTRILELRFPRRDVDKRYDAEMLRFIDGLMRAETAAEVFASLTGVVLPALLAAVDAYCARADALDDAPTFYLMRHLRLDVERSAALASEAWHNFGKIEGEQAADPSWVAALAQRLNATGGIDGSAGRTPDDGSLLDARPAFVLPRQVRRDLRFRPARFHLPHENKFDTAGAAAWRRIEAIDKRIAMQVWSAISHFNEIWAAEIPCSVLFEIDNAPWEFYLDLSRWAWDESRHSFMGYRTLTGWGWDVPALVPYGDALYNALAVLPAQQRLALLYYYEEGLLRSGTKQIEIQILESAGDAASSQDMDYDWADEAIHVSFGFRWLRHLTGVDEAGQAELARLTDSARALMADYVAAQAPDPEAQLAPYFERLLPIIEAMAHDIPDDHLDIRWAPIVADAAALESL